MPLNFCMLNNDYRLVTAEKMGWVISKSIEINPMTKEINADNNSANNFANRLTVVTKRISDIKSIETVTTTSEL